MLPSVVVACWLAFRPAEFHFAQAVRKKEDAAGYLTEANKIQWTPEQTIIFTFFSWLFKKADRLNAEQEKNMLTRQLENYKGIEYNFSEIREWLNESSFAIDVKEEITAIIDVLDAVNKK